MDQKRLKGGIWLYNTALNIFTTCGKSFMHRLLCRFEESCHQSRQCFIKGKKKERDIPLPAQLTALVTPPPAPKPSQWCFLQNQGEGRKLPLMKITLVPINTATHISSLCMLNKAGKKLPRQSVPARFALVVVVAHLTCVHTVDFCFHTGFFATC